MARTFYLDSNSGTGSYQGRYLKVECTQTTDIATNKSTIHWTLTSLGGISTYYGTGPTTLTINGVQVYYSGRIAWETYQFPAAKGSVSGTTIVDHNADGSKTITVGLSTAVSYFDVSSFSGTWTLDSIPRQAKITAASNFTDVDNPSISFSNPGGFPMDVWLEPNPIGDHLCERKSIPNTGSYTWVLTDAEREALRNKCAGKSCTIRLGLYSYVGGVQYADYKDMTYTMTENAATKPSVSLGITLNNGQLPSKFNSLYIQGKSRLNVSLSATGKYGAAIKSYWGTVEGKTYNGSSFTTDVVQGSGTVDIVGYATDSRDFTGSASGQINVIAYSKPLVIPLANENAILCYRSDGNGNRIGSSTSVWIKAKRSYHTLAGNNTCALQWRWKRTTEAWNDSLHLWNDLLTKATTADEYSALIPGEFDKKQAYTIQIRAVDDIGDYDIKTLEVPTEDVALHLGRGGKNVTVGTYCDYSEDYTFRSAWKGIFDEDVYVHGGLYAGHIKPIGDYMGLDLNELTSQTGYYAGGSAPTAAAGCKNFPVEVTGMLTVIGIYGFSYQTYTTYNGLMYARSYYIESGWTPWRQIQMV